MPTYEYECSKCDHAFEVFQSMSESAKRKCPSCGRMGLRRLIGGGAAILFKGSGFYSTDNRSSSYREGEKAEKSSGTTEASCGAGGCGAPACES